MPANISDWGYVVAETPTMHVEVDQTEGLTFLARGASNHWVVMDASLAGGGHGAGANPMELLLMAVGGCTAMDIVAVLEKQQEQFTHFHVELSGERAGEYPKRFTRIFVDYVLTSDEVVTEHLVRAIKLSAEKYCSVGASLAPGVTMVHRYHLLRSGGEETGTVD